MHDQDFFETYGKHVSGYVKTPLAMVDRSFRIRAVNAAFERAALRGHRELVGVHLFDAFPDNPDDPEADGNDRVAASFDTVLRTNAPDSMRVQRYDIPDPTNDGEFIPRVWIPKNSPVANGSGTVGILQQVVEVSDVSHAVLELAHAIETATEIGAELSSRHLTHTLAAFTAALPRDRSQTRALAEENEQLRRALETRDVIGQAKGVLMERFGTDAERAFEVLVKLSQDSNTRVPDVARRVVEGDQATR